MKKPTQSDVARLAGVSRATVSFVVNGKDTQGVPISKKTRERVLDSVKELGYVVNARAQALRRGDTKTIGVVLPIYENPFFWQILVGISAEAEASGYKLLLAHNTGLADQELQNIKELSEQRIDGLILLTEFETMHEQVIEQLRNSSSPIVEISSTSSQFDLVKQGYTDATFALMQHLFDLGHEHIGFIYGVHEREQGLDRLQAYEKSFEKARLPFDASWVCMCEPTVDGAYQATLQVLKNPDRPTALIVINDLLAMASLRAAADLGFRVPDDVSIAGFDNIPFAEISIPRLTTVSAEPEKNGRDAVKLILERLKLPDNPQKTIEADDWKLLIRESTGQASSIKKLALIEKGR